MQFKISVPMGRNNPVTQDDNSFIYFKSISVEVFNQDDMLTGSDFVGSGGTIARPRWSHEFTSADSAVYKPSDGDKYRARVQASWKEEHKSGNGWTEARHGDSRSAAAGTT